MSHTNRLIHETSPYLLQHAHNPVDWHPWGEEALERARREDKPILLSIGYSACHWCHVMEHESFEDEDVARVMNELFINIKVDREERPDLDKIYQTAHQILASRPGGWPLNMFLTPEDHMPFFGGTYFPKTPRYGMPGFTDVLKRVASFYREKRDAVENQNAQVREIFARLQPAPAPGAQLDTALLARAAQQLKRQYDARHGGFGRAPKFPHPTSIELCLRLWARSRAAGGEDHELLGIARHTLRAMALGGIYDQLGGGFCRYSVDDQWMIPHFEKMLYDNGQLLALYADAFAATGEALFGKTAAGIGEWVVREMQSPEGGYCSSLDADSEGHEGKFFVWTAAEIRALLDDEEWRIVSTRYRLGGEPNFEGKFHLHAYLDNESLAAQLGQAREQLEELLASAHRKLLATRGARIAPGRDDKILTSWNALMIKGMARAARRLARTDLLASAERAFDFVRTRLWQDGRLRATAKDGRAHLNAYLDDYAYLIDAGLELLQARWNSEDLTFVCALADTLIEHFEDEQVGGFFFTSDDHERLAYRPKPAADEAVPSGNGIAAHSLARLGHLLGDLNYLHAAERVLEGLRGAIHEHPSSHATLLLALDEQLAPPQTVVIRGEPEEMRAWCAHAAAAYVPWRQGYAIAAQETALPGMLGARAARDGVTTAYVCAGHTCGAPVVSRAQFEATLAAGAATTA